MLELWKHKRNICILGADYYVGTHVTHHLHHLMLTPQGLNTRILARSTGLPKLEYIQIGRLL